MSDHANPTEADSEVTEGRDLKRRTFLGGAASAVGLATFFSGFGQAAAQEEDELSIDEVISNLSIEEKVGLLHQHNFSGVIPGLPKYGFPDHIARDGPNGVRGPDSATAFPTNLTAAATFDPDLIREEAAAIGREVKADDANNLLAPANNINRVPVCGRNFEYYSEDPMLSAEMAVEFTKGVQSENVMATTKHYVANSQEDDRGSINADVRERALREIYFPAFKAAIQEGNAASVMTALNKVNGEYCSENEFLLRDVLRDDWGFEGYVISDFFGVHSTVDAALSGHDIELVSGRFFGDPLLQAVRDGIISEDLIDEKVRHFLRAYEIAGTRGGIDDGANATEEHLAIAEEIVEEGTVLLKNEDDVLPLDETEIDSLALVGPEPGEFRIAGGGSSEVSASRVIGLEEGIQDLVGDDVSINAVSSDPYRPVGPETISPPSNGGQGFLAEYFSGPDFSGSPASSEVVEQVMVDDVAAASGISGTQSVRWSATVSPEEDGTYGFQIERSGAATLSIDGDVVVEKGGGFGAAPRATGEAELEAGETYDLQLEITDTEGGSVYLRWDRPDVDPLHEATLAARDADAAIAVVRGHSSEGSDRDDMLLDGDQDELVHRVAATNENSIVLVNTGGPVRMPWVDFVAGAMFVGYPGQEAGSAVANLLFGEATPSGKLPQTFGETMLDYPADEPSEYPGVNGTSRYDEGVFVGYRYFDEMGEDPIFPFGHGLSYTDFEYSDVKVTPRSTRPDDGVTVEVDVANVGDRDGAETVQVYVGEVNPAVERPPRELKGFAKTEVAAGRTETVEIELGREAFHYWDPDADGWLVDGGEYRVSIGSSSRDLRENVTIRVRGEENPGRGKDGDNGRGPPSGDDDEDDNEEGGRGPSRGDDDD